MKAEYMKLAKGAGPSRHMANVDSDEEEERKALIAPDERKFDEDKPYRPTDEEDAAELEVPPRSRRRLTWIVLLFSLLLISAAIPVRRLLSSSESAPNSPATQLLYSNGTHEFRKSALIVSIDGLRYVCVLEMAGGGRAY